jgi:hypothetical protein
MKLYLKNNNLKPKTAEGVALVARCFPNKHKALSSNPRSAKKRKKNYKKNRQKHGDMF